MHKNTSSRSGFTIVELTVVVIVIAILAVISIVGYNGIRDRARENALKVNTAQARDKLEFYESQNKDYPLTGNLADAKIVSGNGTRYEYTSDTGARYCLSASYGSKSFYVDSTDDAPAPKPGLCPSHSGGSLPPAYSAYRFQVTNLRDINAENSMQISEFQLLDGITRIGGATAYGFSTNSPGGEMPAQANDNNLTTKFLDFSKTTGYFYLVFPSPVSATGYRIGTANDAVNRDPISWTIYGSNNTSGGSPGTWTFISSQTNATIPTTRNTYAPDFSF